MKQFTEVNRELWLVLSLFVIAALCNFLIANRGMLLSFYTFPTLFSAYYYGRRHAALMTALASVLMVVLVTVLNPKMFEHGGEALSHAEVVRHLRLGRVADSHRICHGHAVRPQRRADARVA